MPTKSTPPKADILIASDLDPVSAAESLAGLLRATSTLPPQTLVALEIDGSKPTVPSLQLFFAAHRWLEQAGHAVQPGTHGAAVCATSNLSTVSMTKVQHG